MVKETTQFEPEILQAMATALGLNLEEQSEFHWVSRDCLLALRQEGWMCVINEDTGDLTFVNVSTEECRSTHPTVAIHRSLAERLTQQSKELQAKRKDRHYLIKEVVFKCCIGTNDVRKVTSPRIIEYLLELLSIDVHSEVYLIRLVKVAVEDAYFQMKKEGAFHLTADNIIDVNKLIVQLELQRFQIIVILTFIFRQKIVKI